MTSIPEALEMALQHHRSGNLQQAEVIYRQVLQVDPGQAEAWHLLGIIGWQTKRYDLAIDFIGKALMLKPTDSSYHCNLGVAYQAAGKLAEAVASYRQSLRLRPDAGEVYHNLGNALKAMKDLDESAACFRRAIELNANVADSYNVLGTIHAAKLEIPQAEECYRQAIAIEPNFTQAHHNRGAALFQLGRLDDAVASYGRTIELQPDLVSAHFGLALTLLTKGDFSRGWEEYEWRWKLPNNPPPQFAQPLWDGSPLDGKTILIYAEQGLGDTLQFIRYAPLIQQRGGRTLLKVPRPLVKLLGRSPGIDQLIPASDPLPPFDVHVPLLTVPRILQTTPDTIPSTFPYLFADPELVEQWRRELEPVRNLKIGIAWQGDPKLIEDRQRSIPLRYFAPLARLPGVRLFSLQKGPGSEQVNQIDFPLTDLGPRLDEAAGPFMDTAAVMKNLDLVLTADTALAHLAGGLGVPVWVAISLYPYDWRWPLDREDSWWYPTVRLFRQKEIDNWTEVFERIGREVSKRLAQKHGPQVTVPISPGELIDKITILEIKSERMKDEAKLRHVRDELTVLVEARDLGLAPSAELTELTADLRRINEKLWDVEDAIRECERRQDFGPTFVELARSVYRENDRRAAVKRRINVVLGSRLVEEKSYGN